MQFLKNFRIETIGSIRRDNFAKLCCNDVTHSDIHFDMAVASLFDIASIAETHWREKHES